jgi:hypothetical protein
MLFDDNLPSLTAMTKYFDQYGLKEPTSKLDTIFAYAFNQLGTPVYEILSSDQGRPKNMMLAMSSMEQAYPSLGTYDLSWAVESTNINTRPVLVDVGGGKGQSLKAMISATPGLTPYHCVLEDLPQVIEAARSGADTELAGARFVGIDFHNEQPVKGALVYFIRRCLHNYSDDDCVSILQRIADAMAPDSRLLIVEQVMGNPPSAFVAAADLFMLGIGGKERTQEGFEDIFGRAGLKVLRVWRNVGTDVATVECGKVQWQ